MAQLAGRPAAVFAEAASALEAALRERQPGEIVLVAGSLFLVAAAREALLAAGKDSGMRGRWPIFSWLALLLLLAVPAPALAIGETLRGASPVDLAADELSYDKPSETWRARGDVRLQKGDLTLLSDLVRWDPGTGQAEAVGHVRLTSPEAITEGEDLSINMESGTGRLSNGRILLRETNYRIAGKEIDRLGENRYRVTDGTFTTCEGRAAGLEILRPPAGCHSRQLCPGAPGFILSV